MTDWQCGRCRAQVAPGAPRCPACPSTQFIEPDAEAGEVLKIARDGSVSDSAGVRAAEAAELAGTEERLEPEGAAGTGAQEQQAPEAAPGPAPALPPVSSRPPRRSPPPGGAA